MIPSEIRSLSYTSCSSPIILLMIHIIRNIYYGLTHSSSDHLPCYVTALKMKQAALTFCLDVSFDNIPEFPPLNLGHHTLNKN